MTTTQKTPWAEFLLAKRLHKKKNPGYHDINTEESVGRIPMGERSHEEKPRLYWHQHGRLHRQKSLWAKRLHKKKTLALMTSTGGTLWDIQLSLVGHRWKNRRNSCGQNLCGISSEPYGTSNGELLRAGFLWVILWKTCGQKSHGRPKPCGHSMGHLSTRSYGHLTCLDIFSVGQLLIFTLDSAAVKSKISQFQFALAFL